MCFSASVSFTASAVIFAAGFYTVVKALKSNRYYLPLALIPILFSIQQLSEGVIWRSMTSHHVSTLHGSMLVYMFFAFLVWPAYWPFALYYLEPKGMRKKILMGLTILGFILGALIYIPLLTKDDIVYVAIEHKSLAYSMQRTVYTQWFYAISYAVIIFFSSFCCSKKEIKWFGALLLMSFLISISWFLYAFASTWCFFSAFLSLHLVWIMYNLPQKAR